MLEPKLLVDFDACLTESESLAAGKRSEFNSTD